MKIRIKLSRRPTLTRYSEENIGNHDRVTEDIVGVAHHEVRAESDSGGASR